MRTDMPLYAPAFFVRIGNGMQTNIILAVSNSHTVRNVQANERTHRLTPSQSLSTQAGGRRAGGAGAHLETPRDSKPAGASRWLTDSLVNVAAGVSKQRQHRQHCWLVAER